MTKVKKHTEMFDVCWTIHETKIFYSSGNRQQYDK